MKKYLPLSIMLLSAMGMNCPAGGPLSLDGDWRITSTSGFGVSCITLSNNTVTIFDDGCDGSTNAIQASSPAAISGDNVVLSMTVSPQSGPPLNYTLDLIQQADGSFRGTQTARSTVTSQSVEDDVVMTRE